MKDQVRVLMLVPNLRVSNGVSSFVMNYFRNLDHDAVQMDFALYSDRETPYYDEIKNAGGKIFVLPSIKNVVAHIEMCDKILRGGQYDIIHDNTLHISLPMMWCAKWRQVPVRILHSHSSRLGENSWKEFRNKLFLPFLRKCATDYFACSHLAGNMMFGSKRYTLIPNVIEADRFYFDKKKRNYIRQKMLVQDKFVIGTVGRLAAEKNPFFAIDVFEKIVEKIPNAEYWWIGSGPLDVTVSKYINEKKLNGHVRMLGSRSDVADFYQGMDVFFLPSIYEGLSIVTLEAQATGLYCVISDRLPMEVTYTNLVERHSLSESVHLWAEALVKSRFLVKDRMVYRDFLRQSMWTDQKCGERLAEIYQQMLNLKK